MKDLYTILNLKTKQAKVETIEILGGKMPKRFSSVKILNKATKLEEEYQIYYDKKFNMYAIRDEDYSIMDSILAQRIMQVRETEFHAGVAAGVELQSKVVYNAAMKAFKDLPWYKRLFFTYEAA